MKKGMLFLALVGCMVIAFATIAYATWGDGGTYAWFTTGVNAGRTSPHKGYTAATQSCGVCHAVHNAAPGDVLLSTSIAGSCDYCHVGGAGGYVQVYNGWDTYYNVDNKKNHSNACTTCHAVHGANTITGAYILKATTSQLGTPLPSPVDRSIGTTRVPGGSVSVSANQSQWCSTCHRYTATMDPVGAGYNYYIQVYDGRSHVMTVATSSWNNGSIGATRVAWNDTTACKNCHADTTCTAAFKRPGLKAGNGFPHYTDGQRFLLSGYSSTASSSSAGNSRDDGVCLRCHNNGSGLGIGSSF